MCMETLLLEEQTNVATQCEHVLHGNCVAMWVAVSGDEGRGECPVCRLPISSNEFIKILRASNSELKKAIERLQGKVIKERSVVARMAKHLRQIGEKAAPGPKH